MGTLMQKKAAEITVEKVGKSRGKKISKGEIILAAGYGNSIAKNPDKVFETEGFKEELAALGFSEELVKKALTEDILGKPRRRVKELELAANILRMTEEKGGSNKTLIINITGENAERFGLLKNEPNKSTS